MPLFDIFNPKKKIINENNASKDAILARISKWDQYYGNLDAETTRKINAVREALSRQTKNENKAAVNSDWVINELIGKIDADLASGNYGIPKIRLDLIIREITTRETGGRSDGNKSYTTPQVLMDVFIAELRGRFDKIKSEYTSAKLKLEACARLNGTDSLEYQIESKEFEHVQDMYNSVSDILLKKLDDRNTKDLLKIIEEQTKVFAEGNAELDPNEILEKYSELRKQREIAAQINTTTAGIRDEMDAQRAAARGQTVPAAGTARGTTAARGAATGAKNPLNIENIKEKINQLAQTEEAYNEKIDSINAEYISINEQLNAAIQERKAMPRGTRAAINSKINSLYSKKVALQKKINIFSSYRDAISKQLELYQVADAIQDGKNVNDILRESGIAIDDVETQAMQIQGELKALEAEIAKLSAAGAVVEGAMPEAAIVGDMGEEISDDDLDDKFDYMLEDPRF